MLAYQIISPKAFSDFQGFRAYSLLSFNDLRDKVPSCLPDHDPSHFDAIFKYHNDRDDLGALSSFFPFMAFIGTSFFDIKQPNILICDSLIVYLNFSGNIQRLYDALHQQRVQ